MRFFCASFARLFLRFRKQAEKRRKTGGKVKNWRARVFRVFLFCACLTRVLRVIFQNRNKVYFSATVVMSSYGEIKVEKPQKKTSGDRVKV